MPRPRKDWTVIVKQGGKKLGTFKGENLIAALVKAEEGILYLNPDGSIKEEKISEEGVSNT